MKNSLIETTMKNQIYAVTILIIVAFDGSVFLLNASPDTTGIIPERDMVRYKEFGDEINRRFANPLAETKSQKGDSVVLNFNKPTIINHAVVMEDYRQGERIRKYRIEGYVNAKWTELTNGISVGRKKIDYFDDIEFKPELIP